MKLLLILVLMFLAVLMVFSVLLSKVLGWVAFLVFPILLVGGIVALKSLVLRKMQRAFILPFAAKGAVLNDAVAQIHSVAPTTRPGRTYVQQYDPNGGPILDEEDIEDEDEDDEDYPFAEFDRFFTVDLTISPQDGDGPFQEWVPSELVPVEDYAVSGEPDYSDNEEVGAVLELQIWDNGAWVEGDGSMVSGTQRLRMLLGVVDSPRACRFRYYLEVFGYVELID